MAVKPYNMEYLNCNGLQLSQLGLGTYSMHNGTLKEAVEKCVKSGYRLFDTAQLYENEESLWTILKQQKADGEKIIYQTKVPGKLLQGSKRWLYLNKKSVKQQCVNRYSYMNGSLPDIYLFHSPFQGFERQYIKLLDFQQKYCIPLVGICNVNIDDISSLYCVTGKYPQVVQVEIHPYHSNRVLVDFCRGKGIIVEARSPFAHGDALADWQSESILSDMARTYKKTVPQIILRWITQQQVIAITRTTNPQHIEENMSIFDFHLSHQEMEKIHNLNRNKSFGVESKYNNKK